MPWWSMALLVFGLNFTLWGTVGLLRLLDTRTGRRHHRSAVRRLSRLKETPGLNVFLGPHEATPHDVLAPAAADLLEM